MTVQVQTLHDKKIDVWIDDEATRIKELICLCMFICLYIFLLGWKVTFKLHYFRQPSSLLHVRSATRWNHHFLSEPKKKKKIIEQQTRPLQNNSSYTANVSFKKILGKNDFQNWFWALKLFIMFMFLTLKSLSDVFVSTTGSQKNLLCPLSEENSTSFKRFSFQNYVIGK